MKSYIRKETFLRLCESKGFKSMEEVSVHFGFSPNWLATAFHKHRDKIESRYHEKIRRIEEKVDYGGERNTLKKYAGKIPVDVTSRDDEKQNIILVDDVKEPKKTQTFGAYDRGLGARLLFLFTGKIRKKRIL